MKSIILNQEEIKSVLDGRKSQKRIVIKPQPPMIDDFVQSTNENGIVTIAGFGKGIYTEAGNDYFREDYKPKYQVGDVLWVKEAWRIGAWDHNIQSIAVDYKADNFIRKEWLHIENDKAFEKYWIQSTDDAGHAGLKLNADGEYEWEPGKSPTKWRPSIHMPREAARLFLEVTDRRVERLQDIKDIDIKAEGIVLAIGDYEFDYEFSEEVARLMEFQILWDSTIKKQDLYRYGYNANPWVINYEFKRTENPKGD